MNVFRTLYIYICVIAVTSLSGCIAVPDADRMIVGSEDRVEEIHASAPCSSERLSFQSDLTEYQVPALNADYFKLLTWNILKERKEGWEKEFDRVPGDVDLFVIQEAHLTDSLKGVFRDEALNWVFAPAFTYRGDHVGVLTASSVLSEPVCMERFQEPLIHLPKSVLVTRYPLSVPGKFLLVVNIHAINFDPGIETFRTHWARLEEFLSAVEGPVIVAGDFNTWSDKRLAVVQETTRRLSLEPVVFDQEGRSTVFGNVLDHVYYRGVTPIDAEVYEVTTSDHNPIVVAFRLDDTGAAPETFFD